MIDLYASMMLLLLMRNDPVHVNSSTVIMLVEIGDILQTKTIGVSVNNCQLLLLIYNSSNSKQIILNSKPLTLTNSASSTPTTL